MDKSRFHNQNGSLTRYAFACGYIEEKFIKDADRDIHIWMYFEGACFHVRAHDYKSDVPDPQGNVRGRLFWDCFEPWELTKARQRFARAYRELKENKPYVHT